MLRGRVNNTFDGECDGDDEITINGIIVTDFHPNKQFCWGKFTLCWFQSEPLDTVEGNSPWTVCNVIHQ